MNIRHLEQQPVVVLYDEVSPSSHGTRVWNAVLMAVALCSCAAPTSPSIVASGDALKGSADARRAARLGEQLFFDENLSANRNQSCATCHGAEVGWTGPDEADNRAGAVYEGSIAGRYGDRKPPSSAYFSLGPRFDYNSENGFSGGTFWDGRATGWKLGVPAAEQAQGPFLNPVEQALPDAKTLVERVCSADYAALFRRVAGAAICADTDAAFEAIGRAIAAFESSSSVNQFRSKYDAPRAHLSARERMGRDLFAGKAHCAKCHKLDASPGQPALFTDFTYDNLGVPRNPDNPFYGMDSVLVDGQPINPRGRDFIDPGLGGFLEQLASGQAWRSDPYVAASIAELSAEQLTNLSQLNRGKHQVPTLRNVGKRPRANYAKAYMHNGYFKTLPAIVHFYNTRDVLPRCADEVGEAEALAQNCWPQPEVDETRNTTDVGNLGLSSAEEAAVVAFLETLSDETPSRHAMMHNSDPNDESP